MDMSLSELSEMVKDRDAWHAAVRGLVQRGQDLVTEQITKQSVVYHERVTGRKARGLQTEEIACKCQTFLSLLSSRRKQTSNIFFPSLCKFKGFS